MAARRIAHDLWLDTAPASELQQGFDGLSDRHHDDTYEVPSGRCYWIESSPFI